MAIYFYSLLSLFFQCIGFFAERNFFYSILFIGSGVINLFLFPRLLFSFTENSTLNSNKHKTVSVILLVSFITSLFRPSFFENDYYRYFLDGFHLLKNVPVYQYAPLESPFKNQLPVIFNSISFVDVRTVYPPFTIIYFAIMVFLANFNFFIFKLLLKVVSAVILTTVASFAVGKQFAFSKTKIVLILLLLNHPFLNNELIANIHFDVLLFGLCAYFTVFRRPPAALMFFLWAGAFKTITAISAVFYLRDKNINMKSKALIFFLIATLLSILLFNHDLNNYFQNLSFASLDWEMNSGVFRWIRKLAGSFIGDYEHQIRFAQTFSMSLYLLWGLAINHFSKLNKLSYYETLFCFIFSLPLFLPVCNPWYFVWGFPLLLTSGGSRKRKSYFLYSYAPLFFYYGFYILNEGFNQEPGFWLDLEHILIFFFLCKGLLKPNQLLFDWSKLYRSSQTRPHRE